MTVAYQLEEAGTRVSRTTIERRPMGPRDVRLDLKFCGICHSDLVAASDKLGGGIFPMVPGHEMVGTVSEMGAEVQGVSVGDTVGVGCIAHSHGLGAEIELIQPDEIETAWHRLHEGDVQYRFVIDLESLGSG